MKRMKTVLMVGILIFLLFSQTSINMVMMIPSKNTFIHERIFSINRPIPITNTSNNVLISVDNLENDDKHPKITRNGNILVIAYEKIENASKQAIQVVYSKNEGKTWSVKFNFNSTIFPFSSGILQSPDIKYSPDANEFFLTMIDPLDERFNNYFIWIPGDIVSAKSATWLVNGSLNTLPPYSGYGDAACSYVKNWFLNLYTVNVEANVPWNHNFLTKTLAIIYAYHNKQTDEILMPQDVYPNGAYGRYYDAHYILQTSPSYKPEMATGINRTYMVTEYYNETSKKYQIIYKATITDVDKLLGTRGGGPQNMDKYADIECWPWQMYLMDGRDPDISADENNVCVVCMSKSIYGDWDIMCAYSEDNGKNWRYSYVAEEHYVDEKYPAVCVSGERIYCSYVKRGNLYLVESNDGGITWGKEFKVNDKEGTVAEESGTVDLTDTGVVWTDIRNGKRDIYFTSIMPKINIKDVSGGLGVSAEIKNNGILPAENITWSINLTGVLLIGKHTKGKIERIAPGESVTISSDFIFGLGKTMITIVADGAVKTRKGFIFGPFVLVADKLSKILS